MTKYPQHKEFGPWHVLHDRCFLAGFFSEGEEVQFSPSGLTGGARKMDQMDAQDDGPWKICIYIYICGIKHGVTLGYLFVKFLADTLKIPLGRPL